MFSDVLAKYDIPQWRSTSLANAGGFSGSAIWRIDSADKSDSWCLKRWPQSSSNSERIEWIHNVLIFAAANGCPEVVRPVATVAGASFVRCNGDIWELTKWARGVADYQETPNKQKLESAVESLARFHLGTARYHLNFTASRNLTDVFDALQQIDDSIAAIDRCVCEPDPICTIQDWDSFKRFAPNFASELAQFLVPLLTKRIPVQPVIRDIRSEHLFFEDDRVCSIIDFGAMRVDSVACDLARLLGSLVGNDPQSLQHQIDQYSAMRQLSDAERNLIVPFVNAGVLLGIMNWLTWIFVDRREFESRQTVEARVQNLFERFRNLI